MLLPILIALLPLQLSGTVNSENIAVAEVPAGSYCPLTIKANETAERPDGFDLKAIEPTSKEYFLKKVSFFYGDPSTAARIAPASSSKLGGSRLIKYVFGENDHIGIWIECRYRDITDRFVLSKKTESLNGCTVTQGISDSVVSSLECK